MVTKTTTLSVYLSAALLSYAVGSRGAPIAPVDGPPRLGASTDIGLVPEARSGPADEAQRPTMWQRELQRYAAFAGLTPALQALRSGWDDGAADLVGAWATQSRAALAWLQEWHLPSPPAANVQPTEDDAPLLPLSTPSILLTQHVSTTLLAVGGLNRVALLGDPVAELGTTTESALVETLVDASGEEASRTDAIEAIDDEGAVLASVVQTLESGAAHAGHPWPHSADVSAAELATRFQADLPSLGSISVGLTSAGRLINAVQVPQGGQAWTVVQPEYAWGAAEVIHAVTDAAAVVHETFPDLDPLRINHISRKNGGHLRPHRSHQAGRDVDLGLYYKKGIDPRTISLRREEAMDLAANWTMLRRLLARSHIELIIVDRRIQNVLYNYALSIGEDRAWLDSLFRAGVQSVFRHARSHRDHFHVRFCAPRSQELGLRIQPLLVKVPTQNVVMHRVASGDTLGGIARRYGSSVALIQQRNGLRGTLIHVGQQLWVPLYGACTTCPTPPPLQVPPLRRPPGEGDVAAHMPRPGRSWAAASL